MKKDSISMDNLNLEFKNSKNFQSDFIQLFELKNR